MFSTSEVLEVLLLQLYKNNELKLSTECTLKQLVLQVHVVHRCAQAKILDRGQKEQFFEGVEKNIFRGGLEGGHKAPKPHRKWRVGQKLLQSNKIVKPFK